MGTGMDRDQEQQTYEVGKRIVELMKADRDLEAVRELYADHCVSQEPAQCPMPDGRTEGKATLLKMIEQWLENHEVHESIVEGPFPHGDRFAVIFDIDVTAKAGPMAGQRMKMREIGLYTVEGGKIVKTEFMYPPMGG